MKTVLKKITFIALAVVLSINFTSCEATKNTNNKQRGAAIGVVSGALLGAIIGNNVGDKNNAALGAAIGAALGGGAGVLVGNKMDKQAQQIEQEIPGATVERVDHGIVVTFDGEHDGVYFDTAKYNINEGSQETLNKLASILNEYPDTNVSVVGHTDSVGSDSSNMKLSENRAYAVTNYFIHQASLNSSRFNTHWFGETQPVADNNTTAGKAKNRRVNIVIVPNEKMEQDAIRDAGN